MTAREVSPQVAEVLDGLGDRISPASLADGLPEALEKILEEPPEFDHIVDALVFLPALGRRLKIENLERLALTLERDVDVTLRALRESGHLTAETLRGLTAAPRESRLRAVLLAVAAARDEEDPPTPRNHHRHPWWCWFWDGLLEREDLYPAAEEAN